MVSEIVVMEEELHYAISTEEILWGGLLLAVTLAIHGIGMLMTLHVSDALKEQHERLATPSFMFALGIVIIAAWMIVLVNLFEVTIWAGFFFLSDAMHNPSRAFYYALVNFCTLNSGYLPLRWRLLEGMLAMAGLLTFAWSTGVLFTLAQDFQTKASQIREQRYKKRHAGSSPAPRHPSGGSGPT
jgi:hypothetical protein